MEWIQPKIRGDPIGVRTRHTAVAVHADYEQHERGEAEGMCMQDLNFVCSTGSLFFLRCVLGVIYVCSETLTVTPYHWNLFGWCY